MTSWYKKLKARYERNGCTEEQLERFVELGCLTADEYQKITGREYK